MGRPFAEELSELLATVRWALIADVTELKVSSIPSYEHLLCVGSGGSHSAAVFAALLHRARGGQSTVATPLEVINLCRAAAPQHVLLTSASGGNADIIAAARHVIDSESASVQALCMRQKTKLGEAVRSYYRGRSAEFATPSGRDGFLATNSLLATMIILARAFDEDLSGLETTIGPALMGGDLDGAIARPEWIVLFGGWAWPAAQDLESKCSEAALKPVQLSDLRSFGHGRHHWLAKRAQKSAVIVLADLLHRELAEATIKRVPKGVPVVHLFARSTSARASIELLPEVFEIVRVLGLEVGIDPGRPGVPSFGRELYHLGPRSVAVRLSKPTQKRLLTAGVSRKLGRPLLKEFPGDVGDITRAGRFFVAELEKADIGGLVLDYDGTVVGPAERYSGPTAPMSSRLNELLSQKLTLGIATGRGKSVRNDLRKVIDAKYWSSVVVGYYNGGIIKILHDDEPDITGPPFTSLQDAYTAVADDRMLGTAVKIELRPTQLSVTPLREAEWKVLRNRVIECIASLRLTTLKVVESTHSIDILPEEVSKLAVVKECARILAAGSGPAGILKIGDCGAWPGNDAELLATELSLSVDTTSADPSSCWNLLPPGTAGPAGTFVYLSWLRMTSHGAYRVKVGG